MKSKYIAARHSFQEQPQESEMPTEYGTDWWDEYLSTLRFIPCRPGDKWEEGFIYEEHLDYTVYAYSDENRIHRIEIVPVNTDDEDIYDAVRRKRNQIDPTPEPPTTEQTGDMWMDVIDTIIKTEGPAIPLLDEKYSITRKQEVPEAVSFAEWIAQKHYYKDVHKEWYGCERGMTVLIAKTTAELFELFKNRS